MTRKEAEAHADWRAEQERRDFGVFHTPRETIHPYSVELHTGVSPAVYVARGMPK